MKRSIETTGAFESIHCLQIIPNQLRWLTQFGQFLRISSQCSLGLCVRLPAYRSAQAWCSVQKGILESRIQTSTTSVVIDEFEAHFFKLTKKRLPGLGRKTCKFQPLDDRTQVTRDSSGKLVIAAAQPEKKSTCKPLLNFQRFSLQRGALTSQIIIDQAINNSECHFCKAIQRCLQSSGVSETSQETNGFRARNAQSQSIVIAA